MYQIQLQRGGVRSGSAHDARYKRSHSHPIVVLLLLTIAASIWSASDALSLFQWKAPRPTNTIHRNDATTKSFSLLVDESNDFTGIFSPPPAFQTFLHSSATYRHDRNSRQHHHQNSQRFFRREGKFQLNYKDYDDDYFLTLLDSPEEPTTATLRTRIFRGWRRKSLSKVLFPRSNEDEVEEEGNRSIFRPLGRLANVKEEEVVGRQPNQSKQPTTFKRKKRNKVVVSNIQELHEAILDNGLELRHVELNYTPPSSLLTSLKDCPPSDTASDSDVVMMSDDVAVSTSTLMDQLNVDVTSIAVDTSFVDSIEIDENDEPNAEEWQMIGNVLAENNPFSNDNDDTSEAATAACDANELLFSHDVLNLLHQRYHSKSTPMHRSANDTAVLALAIEGGGMRGAVSGGMAAAIACLGLSDAFDKVYGSSAGSIIGSYFVSRQLYLDVYTDVIPAGKLLFVNKARIIGDIFRNMFYVMMRQPLGKRLNANVIERFRNPASETNITMSSSVEMLRPTRTGGLNTSFVLDSIMCPQRGLRPLDLDAFAHNDAVQPLRIGSSAVELETGRLKSICFGSKEGHFRDQFANLSIFENRNCQRRRTQNWNS